jgi:hypothetical protein
MKEVCLPFAEIPENETAEVEVKAPLSNRIWKYRIESFLVNDPFAKSVNNLIKIEKLRKLIKDYDHRWELIQIYDTNRESEFVHVLYRERKIKIT